MLNVYWESIGILIEVHGNETALVLVEGQQDELAARRAAYEAMFGEPTHEEERATDATIREFTTIRDVHRISAS